MGAGELLDLIAHVKSKKKRLEEQAEIKKTVKEFFRRRSQEITEVMRGFRGW